jgi:mannan endo-1,4-beta-mannosidase
MKRPLTFIFGVGLSAAAATYAVTGFTGHRSSSQIAAASAPDNSITAASAGFRVGVFEPGAPRSYAPVEQFAARTGIQPRIAAWYGGWGDRFWTTFATEAIARGALPFVQINPGKTTMAAVASGREDTYISYYARAVREFGKPVIIGFAAEPNGTWDQWGKGHTPASTWIAAWRHFVTVFREQGARNVIWLWTINSMNLNATRASPQRWWPGASYVTWVGIDGYYYRSTDTFASVFGTTIADVRKFTTNPIIISESGVGPVAGPEKIAGMFNGARQNHLVGIVWFDMTQHGSIYHQDWRLEDSPAALAAFSKAANAAEHPPRATLSGPAPTSGSG